MIWLLLAAETATLPDIHLICSGQTAANIASETTTANVTDNRGYAASGSATTSRPTAVSMAVQFRIIDGKAEANVPRFAVPALSGGGKGGWYPVKDVKFTDDQITGKVRYNFMDSSTFTIDRTTGILTSSGGFQALCTKVDRAERKF